MKAETGKTVAGIRIPDSAMARQATGLLMEHGTELLYNHSLRTFLFGAINGRRHGFRYDAELLYVGCIFHDMGLLPPYRSPDKRFEVDGANAARSFLKSYGLPDASMQLVWDAIALHTSPGIAEYKEAEVALLHYGAALDVVGRGYEALPRKDREEILARFPRTDFKERIIPAFFEGFRHKPHTTYGSINADICACMMPDYRKVDFCDAIRHAPWSE